MVITELHPDASWVTKTLSNMSLKEKVGQLFCPTMMSNKFSPSEQIEYYATHLRDEIETFAPGGYYLNRYYAGSTPHFISLMQKQSKVPLFIAADMEAGAGCGLGGIIAPGFTSFPPAMAVGATDYPQYAYNIGYHTAREARMLGVNYIFAPVLDVNSNPKNPIVNIRSFGQDPYTVGLMGMAMLEGLLDGEIISCVKHFPGHGDVSEDSHLTLTRNNASLEHLKEVDLLPYRMIMEEMDIDSIMTAHISVPALEPDESIPATLSKKILTDLLRDEFAFQGVIVTDALLMGAITNNFDHGTAAIKAIEAGADLLLMPADFPAAYQTLLRAVEEGTLSQTRIDESVNRILMLKYEFGLHHGTNVPDSLHDHTQQDTELISFAIACDAVTMIKDDPVDLPLSSDDKIFAIAFFDAIDELSDQGEFFFNELEHKCPLTETMTLTMQDNIEIIQQMGTIFEEVDTVVIAVSINVLPDKGTVEVPEIIIKLIEAAESFDVSVILVSFGSPYIAEHFPQIETIVCSYGYIPSMVAATVDVLFGIRKPNGELPVKLNIDLDHDE